MKRTIEQIERLLKRNRSKLKRTVNAIDKLERERARALKPKPKPTLLPAGIKLDTLFEDLDKQQPQPNVEAMTKQINKAIGDPLDIRNQPWSTRNEADEKAKAEILAQQAAHKKVKTQAHAAKSKANRSGERRKMPLQGKDALKAIFGE